MFTHTKSRVRVSRTMLMHWNSGHVTLLRGEFQPVNFSPNLTYGAWRTRVGLCPKFAVFFYVLTPFLVELFNQSASCF